jgi:hypothetical protein
MVRWIFLVLLVPAALALDGCGGKCGLSGSECDLLDCGHNDLSCQLYEAPRSVAVHYRRDLGGGNFEYAAKVIIDLADINLLEGLELEGPPCLDRVSIECPSCPVPWPTATSCKGQISPGDAEIGKELSGKFSFFFDDGRTVTACFRSKLESAL